ncbi:hypothetical protein PTKIN_Ptkin14bG0103400 [Pterospermum kingtungense]
MANIEENNGETRKALLQKEHGAKGEEHSPKDWAVDIKELFINKRERPSSHPRCIYQAHALRDVDTAAFTPKIVSIGPLHHSQEHLKGMEETKINYLYRFLQRAEEISKDNDQIESAANNGFSFLSKFCSRLESLENDIRASYAENLNDIPSEKFLRLVLVDAAFIIELFLRSYLQSPQDPPFLSTSYLFVLVRCDLWLLENQLPFFVLQEIYDSAFGSGSDFYPPFLDLAINFFQLYNDQKKNKSNIGEVNHFTDLLRTFFLPSTGYFQDDEQDADGYGSIVPLSEQLPSATHLHAAGVKLCPTEGKCLLDIKFSKSDGRLEIPSLHLFDETGDLFRNLIALEQYHYPSEAFISDYFIFMDYLVDTRNDADLLVEKKIITHWIGNGKQVAKLFNSLCLSILKGAINGHFYSLIQQLNKYHGEPTHRWKATLKSQYFSTPWRGASTIAAIILLVLTLVQTISPAHALSP